MMMEKMKSLSRLRFLFCVILNVIYLDFTQCTSNLIVEIAQGKLQGLALTSLRSQKEFFGFMGIPYAKPPVGTLRFKVRSIKQINHFRCDNIIFHYKYIPKDLILSIAVLIDFLPSNPVARVRFPARSGIFNFYPGTKLCPFCSVLCCLWRWP